MWYLADIRISMHNILSFQTVISNMKTKYVKQCLVPATHTWEFAGFFRFNIHKQTKDTKGCLDGGLLFQIMVRY